MAVNGLDLVGRVTINTLGATNSIKRLATAFKDLDGASKVGLGVSEKTARAFASAAEAASLEKAAVANLARAQSGLNKELAQTAVLQERANATKRTSLASAYTTRQKGKAVASGAADATAVAEGRVALTTQRALTEEVRRTTLAEEASGRAAVRSAQLASIANRDRIANARLVAAQERATQAVAERGISGSERAATAFGHIGSAAAHVGVVAGGVFAGLIANAVIMDREFAAIVRTSDIAEMPTNTVAQVKAQADAVAVLKGRFDALAQALPISYKELTEIGSAANQLGIQSGQLVNFTQAVAQFSATTGVSVDTASTAFGRLDSLVIDVVRNGKIVRGSGVDHDFVGLADAINKVGVNSVATDQQIINIASQIAGIANTAGLGYKEIVGFSGALASVGTQPFLARGLTTRLFTNIMDAVSEGGKQLDAFAKVSGLTSQQFAQQWTNNPGETLVKLMRGIAASGGDAINTLKDLGVKSILDQPALLRLARAADSNGHAFGLLAQTLRDANNAAGENAKQYAIIANTLSSRLQVGLNRAQIALRDIAESDMGPLGSAIGSLSSGILKFSQGLQDNFKLFGVLDTGIKNSAIFGTALLGVGAVAGLALITAGLAKLAATFIHVRSGLGYVTGGLSKLGAGLGLYSSEAARAAAANDKLAASQARVAATRSAATLSTNAVTPQNSAFATKGGAVYATYAQAASKLESSNNRIISGFGTLAQKGTGAVASVANGLNRIGGAARAAGSAVSSMVGGPLGLIAIGTALVAGGIAQATAAMQRLGSDAGEASVGILAAGTALQQLNSVNVSTQDPIGALFDRSTVSAGKFITSTKQLGTELEHLGGGGVVNDFGAKLDNIFNRSNNFNKTTAALDKLDDGFRNIADSGNLAGAVKGIQTLFKGQSTDAVVKGLQHMDDATSILKQSAQAEGYQVGKNGFTYAKYAQGLVTVDAKQRAVADATDAVTKAFGGNTEAATAYTEATNKLGASATDLNKAFSDSKSTNKNASFGDFIKQADTNYKAFQTSQENAVKIAADTGADLTRLSQLDPHILAGAIKSGKKGEEELARVMSLQDAVATFNAAMAQLGNDPQLYQRFASLGKDAKSAFLKTLHGGGSLEEAFTVTLNLDTQKAISTAEATGKKLDNIKATLALSADPSTAYRAGESAKDYVDGLKAEFPIFGNNLPAFKSGETAKQYIDRLKATMTADANNTPGKAAGTALQRYINGLFAKVHVGADTSAADAAIARATRTRTATIVVNEQTGRVAGNHGGAQVGPAVGGIIRGPGTGTSDSIPAMLSNGEFVVRAAAVRKNFALLSQINGGAFVHRPKAAYATGGYVEAKSAGFEGTYTSRQSEQNARGPAIQVTELSAYDRKLLTDIREAVNVEIAVGTVSRATSTGNSRQTRRGNG